MGRVVCDTSGCYNLHEDIWPRCYTCSTRECTYCHVNRHHISKLACDDCIGSGGQVSYCRVCSRPIYIARFNTCYMHRDDEVDELMASGEFDECPLCERPKPSAYRFCWPCKNE